MGSGDFKLFLTLVDADPRGLLERRRADKNRNRDLVPGDCIRSLTRSRVCLGHYYFEALRANSKMESPLHDLSSGIVMNLDLKEAIADFKSTLGE